MMLSMTTMDFLEKLASKEAVPGGGGASAAVGAFAAALGRMAANLTIGKKKFADVEEEVIRIQGQLEKLQRELVDLVDQDADAFLPLSKAYGMPKETEEDIEKRNKVMEKALYEASIVPLRMMENILEVMVLLEGLAEKCSRLCVSDVGTGIIFGQAALEGASFNVFINTKLMKNQDQANTLLTKTEELLKTGEMLKTRVYQYVIDEIR